MATDSDPLPFRYMAISNQSVCPQPVPERINALLSLGVGAVQLRDKSRTDRTRFTWLEQSENQRGTFLVNGRWDLAVLGGADGVHSPADGVPPDALKPLDDRDRLHGVSTHSIDEIRRAENEGADYVTFGPVYPTPSKPKLDPEDLPGVEGLAKVTDETELPVLALGGVTVDRVKACLQAGAYGVAGIRALFQPEDPADRWSAIDSILTEHFGGS